jgi:hypothetical protein
VTNEKQGGLGRCQLLVANLPPLSKTPVANLATCTAGVVDTGGKKWEHYPIADT